MRFKLNWSDGKDRGKEKDEVKDEYRGREKDEVKDEYRGSIYFKEIKR